ncbi:MAG: hypothetical protein U1C33_01590, partial [Candidatus Cloacimonadaceae bacterium]|nr:hypothetical protein [Candidatus Cloacimonadaceae bacterium]
MNSKIKRRVRGVAVFVVFLAMATTIFEISKKEVKTGAPDFKASTMKYDNMKMVNKARIQMNTDNLLTAKQNMDKLVEARAVRSIEQTDQPGFGSYIFITEKQNYDAILSDLGKQGRILSKSTHADTS